MIRIGEFSKLAKTTIKTLRYYDKLGLLKPVFVDSSTSYRYYTEEQLNTMQLILAYKSAGLNNEAIQQILEGQDPTEALTKQRHQLEQSLIEITQQIEAIEHMLMHPDRQQYTASLKQIDSCIVYCCRGYIPTVSHIYSFIKACDKEFHRTNPDVQYALPDYCCIIYPGESYRETNIFIEYAQSVDRVGNDTPTLKFKTLEAVTAVSVEHHGGYETLCAAYLYAVQWAADNGFSICGDARERYINGPWNCQSKSEWLTEVQLPVTKQEA